MKNKKSKVEDLAKLSKDGKITVKHLYGPAKEYLKPVKPIQENRLLIKGHIGTVFNFLSKRNHLFKPDECNIEVDESEMKFTGNECCAHNAQSAIIATQIKETKHYKALDIDNGREFQALELSGYLRRRKNMFVDSEQFHKVFMALSSFEAEIETQIKQADDKKGNYTNSIKKEVTHNMPRVFQLLVQIFENTNPIQIEIEVDVNPNNLYCSLMSFDLEEKYDILKKSLFEDELNQEIKEGLKLRDFCVTYYS